MRRVASLWLPGLAIDRWRRTRPTDGATAPEVAAAPFTEAATVLVIEAAHGPVIHAANPTALAGGARAGGRLTDARALDPALVALPADPAADRRWLDHLARWSTRWSPLVEVDDDDSLRLDVSGVAHLFGGEPALARDMIDRIAAMGFAARVAIAPTAGAAWALARFGRAAVMRCGAPGDPTVAAALAPLPVAGLRLDPQATHTLVRLGLKTIGDLAGVPRKALARRFRERDHPLDALDRALGRLPEPLTATPVDPPPRSVLRLVEPVSDPAAGPQALALLVPGLVQQLQDRRLGARRLELLGYRVDGSVARQAVSTAIPSRDPAHLQRLLADKAAALDPGFGFDAFALVAAWTEDLDSAQEALVGEASGARDVARLIDRLSVKLGPERVQRPLPRDSHIPERAVGWGAGIFTLPARAGGVDSAQPSGGGPVISGTDRPSPSALRASSPPALAGGGIRPPRLLDRPEAIGVIYATPEGLPRRFTWRRVVHDIARAQGPERIAPEWWRERSTARLRDYYRIEDQSGRRFWIFREGIAGEGRGGPPEWFLHGMFG